MARRWVILFAAAAALPACGGGGGGTGGGGGGGATLPGGLPARFAFGLANGPGELAWMTGSGAAWDYRSQYLSGGVNTGSGWSTWNAPAGEFALLYMNQSAGAGIVPVLVYYQIVGSTPNAGDENPDPKFQNAATMAAYFADFKLLMQKCGQFGGAVVVLVEPDLWGHCQQLHGADPASVTVQVTSSGFAEAVGPNTLAGFARTLASLRAAYAPNALLAWHASHWAAGPDLILNDADPVVQADATAAYYLALGAAFQLLSHDPSDRDSGYKVAIYGAGPEAWWDDADFDRYRSYLARMRSVTGLRGLLFQVPCGNTIYRTCNNAWGHYQDNRAQYFLLPANRAHCEAFAAAGVFAVLFGGAGGGTTAYADAQGDGVTNPAAINGNNAVSAHADDDGGFLRLNAAAYYAAGAVPLP
jgi:hypothetical protein